jgi:4'-phosphopantetheinyl transferase
MNPAPEIYWLTQSMGDVPRQDDWLTPGEEATLAKLKFPKRRADWRLGRWTAKCALRNRFAAMLGTRCHDVIEIRAAASGAPVVFIHDEPAPIAISISHSNGVGLCVVSDCKIDVGCDAELVEPRSSAFVTDFFSAEERHAIEQAQPGARPLLTTLMWSAKESVLKVLREGLRRDTRSIAVDVDFENGENGDDNWNRFTARCANGAQSFEGWWRSADRHVYTVAAGRPPTASPGCARGRAGASASSLARGA